MLQAQEAFLAKLMSDRIARVWFETPDLAGRPRGRVVPVNGIEGHLAHGLTLPARLLGQDANAPTITLHADLATASPVAWQTGTVRLLADPHAQGRPMTTAPRTVLRRQVEALTSRGLGVRVGHHITLTITDPGTDQPLEPEARDGALAVPGWLDDLVDLLQASALDVTSYGLGDGPCHIAVTVAAGIGLAAADKIYQTRSSLVEGARHLGLGTNLDGTLTLAVKLAQQDDGSDALAADDTHPSPTAVKFQAGLRAHAPALAAILAPSPDSPRPEAPRFRTDGAGGQILEIPAAADAPAHLALAAVLAAGLSGLDGAIETPPQATNRTESRNALANDDLLAGRLGADLVAAWLDHSREVSP